MNTECLYIQAISEELHSVSSDARRTNLLPLFINKDLEAQDLTDKSKGWTQVWGLGLLDCKLLSATHVTDSRRLRIVTCLIIPSSLFRNSGIPAEPRPVSFVIEGLPPLLPRGTPGTASLTHLQAQKQPEPCTMQPSRKTESLPQVAVP